MIGTTGTIDLKKNPDLAALVADKEPGDWIELRVSIKAKDDQTLTYRIEDCDDCDKPEADEDESAPEQEAATPAAETPEEKPAKTLARKLTSAPADMMG
jgi:hypothetical protein